MNHSSWRGLPALVLLFGALLVAGNAQARLKHAHSGEVVEGREAVANEIIVRFKNPSAAAHAALSRDEDMDESALIGNGRHTVFHSRTRSAAQLLQRLRARADVAYAMPNHLVRLSLVPNEPPIQYNSLWGLRVTGTPLAWDLTTGTTTSVAAVLDTGVDYNHPDLAPNIWSAPRDYSVTIGGVTITCPAGSHGFNAILKTCDPMDDNNHGTHVAGTIGAVGNNGLGVVGLNWTARILGVKWIAGTIGTLADVIDALEYLIQVRQVLGADANVRVANNSWSVPGGEILADQVVRLGQNDTLMVFASGNDYLDLDVSPIYPQAFDWPSLVTVAGTDVNDFKAYFSNYGLRSVHLGAPAMGVISTTRNGGYANYNGTSMAAPHVAGAALLMLARDPSLGAGQMKAQLMNTVTPVDSMLGITVTGGRLNVAAAVTTLTPAPGFVAYAGNAGRLSLAQGSSGSVGLDLVGSNGFIGTVSATVDTSAAPPGLTTGTASIVGGGRINVPLSVASTVPVGDYVLPVVASSAGVNHGATAVLTVTPGAAPDFALWSSTTAVSVRRDKSVSLTLGDTVVGGFNGDVQLRVSGLPREAKARFSTNPLRPGATTTLKLTADSGTPTGVHQIMVTGSSGGLRHQLVIDWTVTR